MLVFALAAFTLAQSASHLLQAANQKQNFSQASASPEGLDFGDQEVQTRSRQLRITLTNRTNRPISISGVDPGEGNWEDFEADDDECTGVPIAPGRSCSIGVIFSPLEVGARSAFLLVTYDDSDEVQKIPVKGNAVGPKSKAGARTDPLRTDPLRTDLFQSGGPAQIHISYSDKGKE